MPHTHLVKNLQYSSVRSQLDDYVSFDFQLPRALVQIVQIMEIYLLPQVSDGFGASPLCGISQRAVCNHVIDSVENNDTLTTLKEINWEYQVPIYINLPVKASQQLQIEFSHCIADKPSTNVN